MPNTAGHPSDDELGELDDDSSAGQRVREHAQECEDCRRRRAELVDLHELLAQTAQRERRPARDMVPSAMMRLRLRRHGVTNANELLEGFAALLRGFASLFSLPAADGRSGGPARGNRVNKDERHE